MPRLTMTYEYYFALGTAWAKRNSPLAENFASDLEKHLQNVSAYLKEAFCDSVESVAWIRPKPPNVLY